MTTVTRKHIDSGCHATRSWRAVLMPRVPAASTSSIGTWWKDNGDRKETRRHRSEAPDEDAPLATEMRTTSAALRE